MTWRRGCPERSTSTPTSGCPWVRTPTSGSSGSPRWRRTRSTPQRWRGPDDPTSSSCTACPRTTIEGRRSGGPRSMPSTTATASAAASRSPTRSSVHQPMSASTRPRTACTPSRHCWWPPSAEAASGRQVRTQLRELGVQLGGYGVAEDAEVLLREVGLLQPGVDVHGEQLGELGCGDVEPRQVQLARGGHPGDGGLHGLRVTRYAPHPPVEHPAVVSESRPQVSTVCALAEPVHLVDARQLLRGRRVSDRQPVSPVVSHVVAAEGQ